VVRTPLSTLFPYTTLFRSRHRPLAAREGGAALVGGRPGVTEERVDELAHDGSLQHDQGRAVERCRPERKVNRRRGEPLAAGLPGSRLEARRPHPETALETRGEIGGE